MSRITLAPITLPVEYIAAAVSRRRFIRLVASGAATGAVLPLLAACGPAAPAAPTVAPSAGTPAAAKPGGVYPTFMPSSGGPKPDFASTGPQYQDGFVTYPKNPVKALPAT